MNFAEMRFWEILFAGLALLLLARVAASRLGPNRLGIYDRVGLLLLGWLLLLAVGWLTCLIFLLVAVGTYVGLKWLLRFEGRARARYLLLLIPLQLAPLFYFKYADFVANGVLKLGIMR